jgi:aspartyl-tRNA(Asn)/glutamyl-tRNA(Gln) amidotransferase subunit C
MALSTEDVKRIAKLARISLDDEKTVNVADMKDKLNGIFAMIETLQSVDTQGVAPLAHPLSVYGVLSQRVRDDAVTEVDNRSANMANAPATENGLFLVPKVIE